MVLGARESWRSLLYNESKNIKNLRQLFAGGDFEKLFLQIIDEILLILLTFHWNTNEIPTKIDWFLLIFQYKYDQQNSNILFSKIFFQNNLQLKVVDDF